MMETFMVIRLGSLCLPRRTRDPVSRQRLADDAALHTLNDRDNHGPTRIRSIAAVRTPIANVCLRARRQKGVCLLAPPRCAYGPRPRLQSAQRNIGDTVGCNIDGGIGVCGFGGGWRVDNGVREAV